MDTQREHPDDVAIDESGAEQVRAFRAPTMREALKKIREELGPDALIISQEAVLGGVEIHAALELPEVILESETLNTGFSVGREEGVPAQVVSVDKVAGAGLGSQASASTFAEAIAEARVDHVKGVDVPAVVTPLPRLPALQFGLGAITDLVGAYRFLGGSGVGKTSLLIKIVVEVAMHRGVEAIEVVSTDNQRLAGTEQLELACQMLGVRLTSARITNLEPTIAALPRDALILIDTTASELQKQTIAPVIGVRDVFVCSAEHSMPSMAAQRRACGQPRLTAVTHLDRPGDRTGLADWLHDTGQSLLFFGASGYVPEGLSVASQAGYTALFQPSEQDNDVEVSVKI